jgi:hypothetical protein
MILRGQDNNVIASEAKQSRSSKVSWIASSLTLLAKTGDALIAFWGL